MIDDILKHRFEQYAPANELEQENMLQETMQMYVLASLARHGLFTDAIFHGGTCLRIVHDMQRFSEDLDFLLKSPDPHFRWAPFVDGVRRDCEAEGIEYEIADRSASDSAVQKTFLKTDSLGKLLYFELPFRRHRHRKLRIKLEIDTNPPEGSDFETAYLSFPRTAPITVQTLASGFALKLHALLCRGYVKGRDWYDFIWYCSHDIEPKMELLGNALNQQGPWAGRSAEITASQLIDHMEDRIASIDWSRAREDVRRFLPLSEQEELQHWDKQLFLYHLQRLGKNLKR